MKRFLKNIAGILLLLTLLSKSVMAVGFQSQTVADPDDKPIRIAIWYPSEAFVPDEPNTSFHQALAIDAEISGHDLPVVVISHGYGSSMGGHANIAKALADAGFVVVAPTHTGNNYQDTSYPASRWLIDRPRHVSRVIDYMVQEWPDSTAIDQQKIGVHGFSAGGYTAMALAGAELDVDEVIEYCRHRSYEVVCDQDMDSTLQQTDDLVVYQDWGWDYRIKAVVAVAPVLGFAFTETSLAKIQLPIQLWSGTDDVNVPYQIHVQPIAERLGVAPELHIVADAGHFSFMQPCDPKLASQPEVWQMICVDNPSFDRVAFEKSQIKDITRFFNDNLLM